MQIEFVFIVSTLSVKYLLYKRNIFVGCTSLPYSYCTYVLLVVCSSRHYVVLLLTNAIYRYVIYICSIYS